jgi:hypothetical protein
MAPTLSAPAARRTGSLLVLGAALAGLAGCGAGVPNRLDFSDTEKVKVTEIVLTGGSGDVMVRTAAIAETRIKRAVSYRNAAEPGVTYRLAGTVLTVNTDCGSTCSVSYDIEAPVGVAVRGTLRSGDVHLANVATADIEVSSGNVDVTGATGAVKVRARSGDLTVTDVHGATQLVATSGDILGTGLGGGSLSVESTSGDVSLALSKPGSVTVRATSGDVNLTVPAGAYNVNATATSGEVAQVGIADDTTAKYVLDVRATSGDVSITQG